MNWASKLATNQSPEDAEAPNTNHKKQRKLRTDKVLNYDNVSLSTNKLQLRNITFINFTN